MSETGWRVFIRDTKSGFFKEAFENCATREDVNRVVERAKKDRLDFKVLDTKTMIMEEVK
jgi:hypothetical protein